MQPLFDYADVAWGEISEGCCKELQRLQNRRAGGIILSLGSRSLVKFVPIPIREWSLYLEGLKTCGLSRFSELKSKLSSAGVMSVPCRVQIQRLARRRSYLLRVEINSNHAQK